MRFRCGQCKTNYNFDDQKIPQNGIKLKCKHCNNSFVITINHVIKADDDKSQRFCSNCGAATAINANKCPKCNLLFNIGKSANVIDNKDYVDLTGKVASQKRKKKILVAVAAVLIILPMAAYFLLGEKKLKQLYVSAAQYFGMEAKSNVRTFSTQGKFLVTLADGSKIDAAQINFEENHVLVVDPDGVELTIAKQDVAGIDNLGK